MQSNIVTKEEVIKDISRDDFLNQLIDKIKTNEFTVHFYSPSINTPSGGVGVLLRLASGLKKNGYKIKVWYEPRFDQKASHEISNKNKKRIDLFEKFHPNWVDFDISDIDFMPLGDGNTIQFTDGTESQTNALKVDTEDILLIPEGFPNIMEKTMQVTCKRVVLAQSWIYILTGLQNGQTWQHLGIKDVISVSDAITDFLQTFMPGMNIKKIRQGIDRKYFNPPKKMSDKFPMIGFVNARDSVGQMKLYNIIKGFYLAYPHLKWVRFIELSGLSREDFADRLKSCAFVMYTDEIAGFGTLPLEAMACGTHVVGWSPEGSQEFIKNNNGFWATNGNVFQMIELLGIALDKWLSGEIDMEPTEKTYESILKDYTVTGEENRIVEIIEEYKKDRINEIEKSK